MSVRMINRFPAAIASADAARTSAVRKSATQIRVHSQKIVPVDTGALRGSAEMTVDSSPGTTTGEVSYNTGYAIYVEMGTSKMAAQPYLIPAFRTGRHVLIADLTRWVRSL